jgi:hypothetical protein
VGRGAGPRRENDLSLLPRRTSLSLKKKKGLTRERKKKTKNIKKKNNKTGEKLLNDK